MYKGVIFDFNGTLFFDNPKHILAWSKISQDIRHHGIDEEELTGRNIRVITNSLAVFNILVNHAPTEVILTGGDYRDNTNTFVGPITNLVLGKLKYNKAFISCNGIYNSSITTYSLEEGESQQIALDNSKNKYLLADNKKFNSADFYIYYDLFNFDTLITDNTIDDEDEE